jgi:hypothetical protein
METWIFQNLPGELTQTDYLAGTGIPGRQVHDK